MQPSSKEITTEVLLCDNQGNLNPEAVGWSRRPLHVCNLRGHFPRKKKWDYWCITGEKFLFSATIAHIDYLSLGDVYFLEYDTKRLAEKVAVKLFNPNPKMAETVDSTETFRHCGTNIQFTCNNNTLSMTVDIKRFKGKPLHASIELQRSEDLENLNVVVPWNQQQFQFTSKQQCIPATGTITWGNEEFVFDPGTAFGCLDFGRGIWPYHTTWNWGSFSGRCGSDIVGLNMGAQWTEGTGANENGILLNGKLYKIHEDICIEYDNKDFMKPWRMTTRSSDTVDLEFTPFYEKAGKLNLLLIAANGHQMFGHFNGKLNVDGKTIMVENILGWAEEHIARW